MAIATANQPRLPAEAPLEPDLPICDPHHHLRERPNDRYFLEEFFQDTRSGHNIVATVCVENRAMYRREGLQSMKPVRHCLAITVEPKLIIGWKLLQPDENFPSIR